MADALERITLQQLRIFRAVARHETLAQAAAELGLGPSSVSSQIRRLGATLGLRFVDVLGRRRTRLTDAGHLLEGHAARIEAQVRELARDLDNLRSGASGTVKVGASSTAGSYLIPPLLAAFTPRFPGITVSLRIGNSADVERWLLEAEIDAGFSGFSRIAPELETLAAIDDQLLFVCAPGHPLAQEGPASLERLARETCLVRERGSATRRVMEERFYERSLELEHPLELPSLDAIKQGVMAGLGISWLSAISVARELEAGLLARIEVPGLSLRRTLCLVRHRRKRGTPALASFLEFARNWRPAGSSRPG